MLLSIAVTAFLAFLTTNPNFDGNDGFEWLYGTFLITLLIVFVLVAITFHLLWQDIPNSANPADSDRSPQVK